MAPGTLHKPTSRVRFPVPLYGRIGMQNESGVAPAEIAAFSQALGRLCHPISLSCPCVTWFDTMFECASCCCALLKKVLYLSDVQPSKV